MSDTPTNTNVNLLNRLTIAEIRNLEFTPDGQSDPVKYKRLVLAGEINGETIEVPLTVEKKDLTLISLFTLQKTNLLDEA